MRLLLLAAAALAACAAPSAPAPDPSAGPPLVAAEDFEHGAAQWKPTDPAAWRVGEADGNHFLSLFQQSRYEPAVRSPKNIAILDGVTVGDFTLDLRVQSTTKDYPHRDICIFFGHQDASHFYYVHLGKQADPHSNSIFLVNGADRLSIAKTRTDGTNWTDAWHRVRIARTAATGAIAIYFDDLDKPAMTAEDKTFAWGRIGVGSFDDTGNFDDIALRGKPLRE